MSRSAAALTAALLVASGALSPVPLHADDKSQACQGRVVGTGGAHKIRSVAELNALRAWSETSARFGEGYSMWHNASGATLGCETLSQGFFRCSAAGKPCLAKTSEQAAK